MTPTGDARRRFDTTPGSLDRLALDADLALLSLMWARAVATRARHVIAARAAGMPETSAQRWPRYLEWCERIGKTPITLREAAAQCVAARVARSTP